VSLQAHTDQLEILADKEITIISVNDVIEIKANQKIVLQAGQSSVTLEGGDITFACPGNFTVKGGQHVFDGGAHVQTDIAALPSDVAKPLAEFGVPKRFSQQLDIGAMIHNDPELIGATYEVWSKSASPKLLDSGTIDSNYHSIRVFTEKQEELEVIIGENEWSSYTHIERDEEDV
jgi:type VI secretion system secreted protein VgrG